MYDCGSGTLLLHKNLGSLYLPRFGKETMPITTIGIRSFQQLLVRQLLRSIRQRPKLFRQLPTGHEPASEAIKNMQIDLKSGK